MWRHERFLTKASSIPNMSYFVAVDIPDSIATSLVSFQPDSGSKIRLVKPDQMHITLHYIGAADLETVSKISQSLEKVTAKSFRISLRGVGTFSTYNKSKVLWAGVNNFDGLRKLYLAVGEALSEIDIELEQRKYKPHVTLARLGRGVPSDVAKEFIEKGSSLDYQDIPINRYILYRSSPINGISHYERIKLFSLDQN